MTSPAFPIGPRPSARHGVEGASLVIPQSRLRRVLAFTGRSIDDVVSDPVARGRVRAYFKLSKFIDRRIEVVELERQWNDPAHY